jgi:hypothetical protein
MIVFASCLDILKNEEITKIASILYHNPLSLRFPAVVIGALRIKGAIEATVQISSAKGAGFPPAHRTLDFQNVRTGMTLLHDSLTRKRCIEAVIHSLPQHENRRGQKQYGPGNSTGLEFSRRFDPCPPEGTWRRRFIP